MLPRERFGPNELLRWLEEYRLLQRLLWEQCHVGRHGDGRPGDDDDDAGEGKVPIALKEPKEVPADSLRSPHDPDATYSGHKGKGYEVQVAESCHEENATQIITHVEVTPSSGSDATVTVCPSSTPSRSGGFRRRRSSPTPPSALGAMPSKPDAGERS